MRVQLSHWCSAVVAPDLVEDLRPQPDVADRAEAVACFRDRDALAAVGDALEERQRFARQLRDQLGARGGQPGELLLERAALRRRATFCSRATSACSAFSALRPL